MVLYHATNYENLGSILAEGIKPSMEGIVYLADTPENAVKFVWFRGWKKILILRVNVEGAYKTYDHSKEFFQCDAYGYQGPISVESIDLEKAMRIDNPMFCDLTAV